MNNPAMQGTQTDISDSLSKRKARIFIITSSIAIPVVVTILHFMPRVEAGSGSLRSFLNFLPTFNAIINGLTTAVLIAAFIAIIKKRILLHQRLMTTALVFSILFLLSYISYHATTKHATFPADHPMRTFYFIILNTHIVLSAVVVPMVLISFSRALARRYDRHRRIARITLPIWLYVTITGVVVYLMISPYYDF